MSFPSYCSLSALHLGEFLLSKTVCGNQSTHCIIYESPSFSYFRLTTELFYLGKIILCIDFVVFCLRLMAIFTISRTLGPKIIIVRKMVRGLQNKYKACWPEVLWLRQKKPLTWYNKRLPPDEMQSLCLIKAVLNTWIILLPHLFQSVRPQLCVQLHVIYSLSIHEMSLFPAVFLNVSIS